MKKIVFDLDNTLIPWEDRYNDAIGRALSLLDSPRTLEEINIIKESINEYGSYYDIYDKIYMQDFFNSRLFRKLPDKFMDMWLIELGNCVPYTQDKDLINLLNELSNYYRMSVFTDWFKDSQVERLRNYGILNYFDDVIGTDQYLLKPYRQGFMAACGNYDPKECLMVGDIYDLDIVGAKNIGMNTVLLDPSDRYKNYDGNKIKKIVELTKFL